MLYNQSLVRVCDNCGSSNFIENFEGFICENCGIVFEIQRFEFSRPYSENNLQHNIYHEKMAPATPHPGFLSFG